MTRYLLGYGVLLPGFLLLTPYTFSTLQFPNVALMLCLCGAVPVIMTLRVIQAMLQQLPEYACKSQGMLILYFCSTLQIQFDAATQQPAPLTRQIVRTKLAAFARVLVQTSLLYSLLLPYNYKVLPQKPILLYQPWCLYSWGNLANGFFMASLTSLVLDGGASGLGLIMSLVSGYAMEDFSRSPLSKSTSPSDFWANRWDRPVQDGLRRGCFQPLCKAGLAPPAATLATFVVSGIIHE